jgi:hypothetical protein
VDWLQWEFGETFNLGWRWAVIEEPTEIQSRLNLDS